MAVNDASGNRITEHPVLTRLLAEGGSDLRSYTGYVGASGREGYLSLYPSLADLSKSFELQGSDVVHVEPIPEEFAPFGAVIVWVRANADVSSQVVATAVTKAAPGDSPTINSGRLQMRVQPHLRKDCISRCECGSTCDGCMSTCIFVCRWPR
jgi:hypothetical protein